MLLDVFGTWPVYRSVTYVVKVVVFRSYVRLPEGNNGQQIPFTL
jgi:hypothetical protein